MRTLAHVATVLTIVSALSLGVDLSVKVAGLAKRKVQADVRLSYAAERCAAALEKSARSRP